MFDIDHYTDDEKFTSFLIAKVDGSAMKVNFKVNDTTSVSEGDLSDHNVMLIVPTFQRDMQKQRNSRFRGRLHIR